jgi:chorismate dehydratase
LKIRISLVHFLNSAPLGWFFLHGPLKEEFDVLPASPARCAEHLLRGEADIGVIPSIECQRIPGLEIIPGISVSSTERVRSVLMVMSPRGEMRSVALDTSSRTSVVLLKLLLERRMGLRPTYEQQQPDIERMLQTCDAALLIGDAALRISPERYHVVDLAEAWIQWQNRPFVFAVWACRRRPGLPSDLVRLFQEAKEWGLARRQQIAESYAGRLNLSENFLLEYLHRNVDYDLTEEHRDGLEKFYRLAFEAGFIEDLRPICYFDDPGMAGTRAQPSPSSSTFQ